MSFICEKPIILLNHTDQGWEVTDDAIRILSKLNKPIKVLAIAGRYRSGKSHIMNKFLSAERGGFDLGHTVKGCTRGIWMWGKDTGKEITLALDTEGLNDTQNDTKLDAKLFSLALLLSSYLVLNIQGVLDEQTIQMLSFVTKLSKIIFAEKTDEKEDDGVEYKEIFPPVMFLLRDFVLKTEDGKTLEDYLAEVLKPQRGQKKEIVKKNNIRDAITQSFPGRDIMAIPLPHSEPKIIQNIQEHEADLTEAFKTAVDDVCSALHEKLKIKRAKYDGGMVEIKDGESYLVLVNTIVNGLNTKGKIEIPSLFEAVCEMERKKQVKLGLEMLNSRFDEVSKNLPLNETDLVDRLESAQKDIVAEISENILDAGTLTQVSDELKVTAQQMQENIFTKNKEASRSLCKELKASLIDDLRKSCASKTFKTVEEFEAKKQEGVTLLQTKGVGPALSEVLLEFDSDCVHIREILYTQLQLQKVEIEAAESARKHEESQRQIEQLRKDNEESEKRRQIREEALKAQNEAIAKKHEEDMRKWREEHEEMKRKFEQELAQAKRVQDTRLLEIAGQQYESYSNKRNNRHNESGGGNKIYVRGYTRRDGTPVKGYWRNK